MHSSLIVAVVVAWSVVIPAAGGEAPATTKTAPAARRPWQPKPAPPGAPVRAYRCRIVSYAGKWTRHGFGNYMAWRHPNGPLAPAGDRGELFRITHDVDVDADGRTDDDYVASLPFSLAEPLSNPDWPLHMAFPGRRSSRFYGGVSWYVANSTPAESRFYAEMGYNPDHSPPWYDGRAEDHPLHGQANEKKPESCHRHYWAILWTKADFLNGGPAGRVTFDETSRLASITTRDYWLGYDDVRMIVQDGEELLISDNRAFDIPRNGYRPARGRVFLLHPLAATWARYEPKGHLLHFDHASASFARHDFRDVRAVGWYLAKDKLEGKQSHVKWYGFEADAIVHRPEQASVHLATVAVPASPGVPPFHVAACELPYALAKDVHRYGDAPFHTLEARYTYRKDGDMGSMLFGRCPHEDDEPVTNLTFYDAAALCNTLSEMEGKRPCYYVDAGFAEVFRNMHIATRAIAPPYERRNTDGPTFETVPPPKLHVDWSADGHRLPTPAEWVAAWQAGRCALNEARAWIGANSGGRTRPVGTSKPDAAGVWDLAGNVWELTWPYGDYFDPCRDDALLALGGSFLHPAEAMSEAASASPYGDEPYTGHHAVGLRLVCREVSLPAPAAGEVPAEVPAWRIRRGQRSEARAKPGPVDRAAVGMVPLPGGQLVRWPDRRTITVSALSVAKLPVTYAAWRDVLHWAEANGYEFSRTGQMGSMYFFAFGHSPDEPVTQVTWHDALVWCNALSEMQRRTPCFYTDPARTKVYRKAFTYRPLKVSGPELVAAEPHRYAKYSHLLPQPWLFVRWDVDGYRLPTEAEFEYCLRGGTQTPQFWGVGAAGRDEHTWNIFNAGGRTHPVGSKKPNPFGLYDIQGNTFEWLWSCRRGSDPTRPAELDTNNPKADPHWSYGQPKEVYSTHGTVMVGGGSFLYGGFNVNGSHGVTVDSQNHVNTTFAYPDLGFRVVCCKAGTHPRDGREALAARPVVLACDERSYDPLEGAAFRANLRRDGVYHTRGPAGPAGVKWKLDTGGAVRSSPVVGGGVVYVGSDGGHFHAVDADTGRERWKLAVAGGVTSSACVAALGGGGRSAVYFGGNDGKLYAVDAADGKVLWTAPGRDAMTGSPAAAYGVVFVEGCWGFDAGTGKLRWQTAQGTLSGSRDGRLSSPAVVGTRICHYGSVADIRTAHYEFGRGDGWAGQNCDAVADGRMYTLNSGVGGAVNLPQISAIDLATLRTLWSREIAAPNQPVSVRKVVLTSPAVWKDTVYVGFDGGLMFAFDAAGGKQRWAFRAGGAVRSSPAVSDADGALYFGCHDGRLYALDAATGRARWTFQAGGKIISSPCPHGGYVYVGCDDGFLYALH